MISLYMCDKFETCDKLDSVISWVSVISSVKAITDASFGRDINCVKPSMQPPVCCVQVHSIIIIIAEYVVQVPVTPSCTFYSLEDYCARVIL